MGEATQESRGLAAEFPSWERVRGGKRSREVDVQEWRERARSGTDHKEPGGWRCKTEHQTGQVREQAWMCERATALLHLSFPTDL
jgi:hypothetical protein